MLSTIKHESGFGNVSPLEEKFLKAQEDNFINSRASLLKKNNNIDTSLYDKYNVKIGLRNKNGTGVCVGLTQISDVHGYEKDAEGNKIPAEGKLFYRGINVEDIVNGCISENRFGYEEVSYLLLFGKLPTKSELNDYRKILGARRELPQGFARDTILGSPSRSIMNQLAKEILALYSYDRHPDDTSAENIFRQSIQLISYFPSLLAYSYQAKRSHFDGQSLHLHYPSHELSTAENILRLIRPTGEYSDIEAKLLDICMILHAEHGGGNNSTFTTHLVSSTGTDTYSAIAAAIGSLKGPKHGGANLAVIYMIKDLKENVADITDYKAVENYLRKVIQGKANDGSGLIYGLGHAVYTLSDPRAQLLKRMARKLAEERNLMDEFMLYDFIENTGSRIFSEMTGSEVILPANVDLYSGFVYNALNIPLDLATPIFAAARISGWCAHRIEEVTGSNRIMRPAYNCIAEAQEYFPIDER
ncbi:MAG: citrate synthase [Anaerovoracaceae bacterium]